MRSSGSAFERTDRKQARFGKKHCVVERSLPTNGQEPDTDTEKLQRSKANKKNIRRLTKEIEDIELSLYGAENGEDWLKIYILEKRRQDIVRAAVLNIHTSIEDVLNDLITRALLKVAPFGSSQQAKALRRMLSGGGSLGFDMKLNFAVAIGVMSETTRKKLCEINTLRNKCSHNHNLNQIVRQGKRPGQKKPPLLNFRGQNLYTVKVFQKFADEYQDIWAEIYDKEQRVLTKYLKQYS